MDVISSGKNDRIKNIAALQKSKKARTEQGVFVAEGLRIARDVFKSALPLLENVFVSESFWHNKAWKEYPELAVLNSGAEKLSFELTAVKDTVFEGMCETVTPQGIVCIVKQPKYSVEEIISGSVKNSKSKADAENISGTAEINKSGIKLLVLEDIQDPGNLGTMVRTAEAAGVDGIIMSRGTVDIFSPKVIRSTMGAVLRVPFAYVEDLNGALDKMRADGISVYAAYLRNGTDFRKVAFSDKAAVLIGNEGNGLSDAMLEHCDMNVFIPMAGEVESLNAAVAAALLMYAL